MSDMARAVRLGMRLGLMKRAGLPSGPLDAQGKPTSAVPPTNKVEPKPASTGLEHLTEAQMRQLNQPVEEYKQRTSTPAMGAGRSTPSMFGKDVSDVSLDYVPSMPPQLADTGVRSTPLSEPEYQAKLRKYMMNNYSRPQMIDYYKQLEKQYPETHGGVLEKLRSGGAESADPMNPYSKPALTNWASSDAFQQEMETKRKEYEDMIKDMTASKAGTSELEKLRQTKAFPHQWMYGTQEGAERLKAKLMEGVTPETIQEQHQEELLRLQELDRKAEEANTPEGRAKAKAEADQLKATMDADAKKEDESEYETGAYYEYDPETEKYTQTKMHPDTVFEYMGEEKGWQPVASGLGEGEYIEGTETFRDPDAQAADVQQIFGMSPAEMKATNIAQNRMREFVDWRRRMHQQDLAAAPTMANIARQLRG